MLIKVKTILITGASSGIGLALARELAAKGANLVLSARREMLLATIADDLRSLYPSLTSPLVIPCDISESGSVRNLISECLRTRGGLDILINNAGICVYGDIAITTIEDARTVMNTNFFGAVNCIREVLPPMRQSHHGLIVNISSVAGLRGVPFLGAYSASKAALVAFSQSLRAEVKEDGISVMNVYPNYTDTELFVHEKLVGGARRPQRNYASATAVATRIVRAMERDREELILSMQGKALPVIHALFPDLVERMMRQIANRLRENKEATDA